MKHWEITFVECAELFLHVIIHVEVDISSDVIISILICDAELFTLLLQNVAFHFPVFDYAENYHSWFSMKSNPLESDKNALFYMDTDIFMFILIQSFPRSHSKQDINFQCLPQCSKNKF